jgi:DNA-3-methyladenine glycosylase II
MSRGPALEGAVRHLKRRDQTLGKVISRVGDCGFIRKRNHFEALVGTVVSQQLSSKAAGAILARLRALCGGQRISVETVLSLDVMQLRSSGISAAKAITIREIAQRVGQGSLRRDRLSKMSDENVTKEITSIKGLGSWSANMYLMFVLHRPDVFPAEDVGIQNAIRRLYSVEVDRDSIMTLAEPWRPFRSIACWYLWRYLDEEAAAG